MNILTITACKRCRENRRWRGGQASEQTRDIQGVRIREVNLAHDALGGQRRGPNTAFVFAVGALTAVHLGDLGHEMTDAQAESIGPCGVVFLPVGGHYTIGPEVAVQVVERLQPNIVVPMHYRTPAIADWPLVGVEEFLALIDALCGDLVRKRARGREVSRGARGLGDGARRRIT